MRKIVNRQHSATYRELSINRGWHVFYQNLSANEAYQGFDRRSLSVVFMDAFHAGSTMYEIHGNCVMFS